MSKDTCKNENAFDRNFIFSIVNFKNLYYLILLITTYFLIGCNRTAVHPLQYIDQERPQLTPKLFASGFISTTEESEFGSVFTADGEEFYYGVDLDGKAEIRYTLIKDGRWQTPKTIISDTQYGYNDPFLSPDESRLYYISNMPNNEQDTTGDHDIWYSVRDGNQWSSPINAGGEINTDRNEYYISFTENGSMYFASHRDKELKRKHDLDIYRSENIGGVFQAPVKLSDAINSRGYEGDVFVAPDESYLIFSAARRSGLGRADLYVSFKNENDNWTDAVILGPPISSANHELCPVVTRDGKYFFYTSNQDIYWVSAEIINTYKTK